jgi:hypothetical protein
MDFAALHMSAPGTTRTKANAAQCPQLVGADIRPKGWIRGLTLCRPRVCSATDYPVAKRLVYTLTDRREIVILHTPKLRVKSGGRFLSTVT